MTHINVNYSKSDNFVSFYKTTIENKNLLERVTDEILLIRKTKESNYVKRMLNEIRSIRQETDRHLQITEMSSLDWGDEEEIKNLFELSRILNKKLKIIDNKIKNIEI